MRVHELELDVERAFDCEKEIEVDEQAAQREEDLLDRIAAENRRKRRTGDDRGEHDQHHERAYVGGQDPVERHRGCVAGDHVATAHLPRIGKAENRVPREAGRGRLQGFQQDGRDQVLRGDLGDGVPQV